MTTSEPRSGEMLLEVNNLSVEYYAASGAVHALTDVSIALERGQILGLVGESGSGKSTLAYAITRLLHAPAMITGGQILYYPRSGGNRAGREQARKATQGPALTDAIMEPVDILQFAPAQLRAFRWSELSIVF